MTNTDRQETESLAVPGVARTMAVLEYVVGMNRPVSGAEIARATAMNPSTAFNVTRTLATAGYLQAAIGTRMFTPGPALRGLSRKLAEYAEPHDLARMPMQAVANRFEVVVSLWRRAARYSMMMLVAAQNEAATRIQVAAGVKMPLMHGSIGRIMATHGGLSEAELRQVFAVVNFERPVAFRTFMAQARLAAERGWSIDDGNVRAAVTSISVPVRNGTEPLEYLLTATMFRKQHQGAQLEALAAALKHLASAVAPSYGAP